MNIGKFTFDKNVFLAPIAGYTDVGFRAICSMQGAELTFTEMISAKGLVYGSEKTEDLLITTDNEKIKAVQIFGSDPNFIEKAVNHEALAKFDIIDINMGCPMPKITKNGDGSSLLNNKELACDIIKAALSSGKIVTAKIRLGIEKNTSIDFVEELQKSGVSAITVHGRTRTQMYSGNADWEAIRKIKEIATVPIIANGDVKSKEDYENILAQTKADGVMIARGALGNPNIFADIKGLKRKPLKELINTHLDFLFMYHPEKYVLSNFKKHMACYCSGFKGCKELKVKAFNAKTKEELYKIIGEIDD